MEVRRTGYKFAEFDKVLQIEWTLGNTCNYNCSYCLPVLHDNSFPWIDLDKSIKDFIQNNPKFIFDVLSKYQDEQNKIEQEKTSQLNNLNITYNGIENILLSNISIILNRLFIFPLFFGSNLSLNESFNSKNILNMSAINLS